MVSPRPKKFAKRVSSKIEFHNFNLFQITKNIFILIPTDYPKMERLQLKCKPLDDLLGGGIESNAITEIHGEAGSGKTNLCLQASREYASKGKKVAYIDSEGVSLERLDQMCKEYDGKGIPVSYTHLTLPTN